MPPLLPIPACQQRFLGQELRTGMRILCAIVAFISAVPLLIGVLCKGNMTRFSSIAPLLASLTILALLCFNVPGTVHFLVNVLWLSVTLFTLVNFLLHVLHAVRATIPAQSKCRVGSTVATIAWSYLSLAMIHGVSVYWSFYVEL